MFEQGVSCMLARLSTSIALLSRAVREEPSAKISSSLPSREVTTNSIASMGGTEASVLSVRNEGGFTIRNLFALAPPNVDAIDVA